jgi:hypothetical protein
MRAWSASDSELQQAASYFAGVCADFVAENPGICTNVPSSITLAPVPVPTNNNNVDGGKTDAPTPVEMPVTSIQVIQTLTITERGSQTTSCITNFVTVPQVQFVTATPTPAPVTVEGGAPAPAPTPSVQLIAAQTPASVLTTIPTAVPTTFVPAQGTSGFTYKTSASASFTAPGTFTGAAGKTEVGFGIVAGVLGVVAFLC